MADKRGWKRRHGTRNRSSRVRARGYPVELRLRVIREIEEGGMTRAEASRVFGISDSTLQKWVTRWKQSGLAGLRPKPTGYAAQRAPRERDARHEAAAVLRRAHPEYGTRRIRDVLRRFASLGISETTVRRVLHEEGLLPERPEPTPARKHPERRFERAAPNELWQSDIFTFLLRRHERLYLAALRSVAYSPPYPITRGHLRRRTSWR